MSAHLCGEDWLQSYGVHSPEDKEFVFLTQRLRQIGEVTKGSGIVELSNLSPASVALISAAIMVIRCVLYDIDFLN